MGREGKAKDARLLKMRFERRSDRVEDNFGPFLAPDPDSQRPASGDARWSRQSTEGDVLCANVMVNIPKGEEILMQGFDELYDLIVIGCGAAGLAAALSSSETMSEATNGDFSIAVLERAPKEERGGNTRWTGAYLRLKDTSTVADRFVEDMLEFSDGLSDERYIRTLAEKAPETIGWIQDKGVQFDYMPTIFLTLKEPRLLPLGGGAAIIVPL